MEIKEYSYDAAPVKGLNFKAKSFIVKTQDYVYIISPAKFDEKTIDSLREYALPLIFIAPTNFHNNGLATMKELFPNAQFFGPKRSANQSGVKLQKTQDLPLDPEFKAIYIEGNKSLAETVFLHGPSESLIVTDILFNMKHKVNLLARFVFKVYGTYHKLAQSKLVMITANDKELFRKSLHDLTKLNFKKVLLNHGDHISKDQFDEVMLNL